MRKVVEAVAGMHTTYIDGGHDAICVFSCSGKQEWEEDKGDTIYLHSYWHNPKCPAIRARKIVGCI